MSITAMKQALEALEYMHTEKCDYMRRNKLGDPLREDAARLAIPAITALRTAIEQAEKQEPVGVVRVLPLGDGHKPMHWADWTDADNPPPENTPLYTTPPAAPMQELERLRDENERLHVENRRLIDRIETMGVPVGVGGFLTTTNAAQRQWVGLTDEEYEKTIRDNMLLQMNFAGIRDDIEAKLREKNGGRHEQD